ncbi:MAG: flavodoxin-dependent (E)-4-hydroxy-3-methylbut-2-enyl-diphosphate synthase, partial [Methanobrevibacter sp.]|nr:flavodoxin-dependent (E)-4-hydroxy-3-methylbut-2-enyl-diphosphate synthase [Methanobrevibacter sp.]
LTGDPVREVYAAKSILKSLKLIKSPDLISCPTCGRTEVDLEKYALEIDEFLKNINKDIKVAVMGCLVNGPGEAKDADMGVAFIKTQGVLFKKGVVVYKGTPDLAIQELKKAILEF